MCQSLRLKTPISLDNKTENDEIPKPSSPELTADCLDDLDYFKDFENEFPAIVYNDGLTSKSDLEVKPPVSSSKYDEEERNALHVTFPDNLKTNKDNNDNIDITQPSRYMTPLPHRNLRHPWLRYQIEEYTEGIVHDFERRLETIWDRSVNRVHILDFEGLTPEMRQDLGVRLRMVYAEGDRQQVMSDTEMGLDVADTLCFQLGGVRRKDRGRRRHAEGRKSGARLSGGHFIGLIDLHELARLNICGRFGNTWAWVAPSPDRQQDAAVGAYEADEAGPIADEGAQEIPAPAPAQAPPPPLPTPQPWTIS
ncbi:hypothetical protein Tco_0789010 [Tanacetum coccineum]